MYPSTGFGRFRTSTRATIKARAPWGSWSRFSRGRRFSVHAAKGKGRGLARECKGTRDQSRWPDEEADQHRRPKIFDTLPHVSMLMTSERESWLEAGVASERQLSRSGQERGGAGGKDPSIIRNSVIRGREGRAKGVMAKDGVLNGSAGQRWSFQIDESEYIRVVTLVIRK